MMKTKTIFVFYAVDTFYVSNKYDHHQSCLFYRALLSYILESYTE